MSFERSPEHRARIAAGLMRHHAVKRGDIDEAEARVSVTDADLANLMAAEEAERRARTAARAAARQALAEAAAQAEATPPAQRAARMLALGHGTDDVVRATGLAPAVVLQINRRVSRRRRDPA